MTPHVYLSKIKYQKLFFQWVHCDGQWNHSDTSKVETPGAHPQYTKMLSKPICQVKQMKTKTIYKNKNPILQIQHSMVDPKTENRWWEMGKLWLHQSYKQVPISHFSNKVNLDFFIFFFCHKLWACLTDGEMVAGASTMEILHCIRVASKEKGQRVNSSSCNMFSTDEPHPCD